MIVQKSPASEDERSDIEALLPWHAAGTLSRRDAQRVEAALADDPELARRFDIVREELAQTIHVNETLGAPSARALAALDAKIDAEPPRRRRQPIDLGARVREFITALSPRTLAWSAAAAALAIVLQAGLIAGIMLRAPSGGGYETASTKTGVAREGSYALIRFAPQASAAAVTTFLEANKLVIVEGPSAGGLYRIRIAAKELSKAERDRMLNSLRTDQVVDFIAAAD
jgi:anti-sigma factor RsiW